MQDDPAVADLCRESARLRAEGSTILNDTAKAIAALRASIQQRRDLVAQTAISIRALDRQI